jgi:hypothetical protein
MMTGKTLNMCAWAYIKYYRSHFKQYAWSCDYADNLIQTAPAVGLTFIFEVLGVCQNEEEIAYVASGLLEDLIHLNIPEINEKLENAIQHNPLMITAMQYVYAPEKSEAHSFIQGMHIKLNNQAKPRKKMMRSLKKEADDIKK